MIHYITYVLLVFLCLSSVKCEDKMLFYGMEPCSNSTTKDVYEITHDWSQGLFSGSIYLPMGFDKSFLYDVEVFKDKNGSWVKMIKLSGSVCRMLNGPLLGVWKKISTTVNIPPECPIPGGKYELKDFSISAEEANVPILKGKYLAVVEITKEGKSLLCREIFAQSSNYKP